MNKPELGLTTKATVVRVIDADTIEVAVTRTFHVRLKDLLAAEKNTPEGKLAKEWVSQQLPNGTEITLFIPANKPEKLMDINTFDRLLGYIWFKVKDAYINLADYIVDNKYGRYLISGEKPHEGI